jgi:hypothetical protein
MRLPGLPLALPDAVLSRVLSDLGSLAHAARTAPAQLERLLDLGEEMVDIGRAVLYLGERIDSRAEAILALGERIEMRAQAILALGERLDGRGQELIELGGEMHELGVRIDQRGGEIVDGATRVAETGGELITVLPALERAIEMTTPLEGAIDRFGRLVDRLPGGAARRRPETRRVVPPAHVPPGGVPGDTGTGVD